MNQRTSSQKSEREEDNGKKITISIKKEDIFNKSLYKLRVKIEIFFEENKTIFKVLQKYWQKEEEQLDYIVTIVATVSNKRKG